FTDDNECRPADDQIDDAGQPPRGTLGPESDIEEAKSAKAAAAQQRQQQPPAVPDPPAQLRLGSRRAAVRVTRCRTTARHARHRAPPAAPPRWPGRTPRCTRSRRCALQEGPRARSEEHTSELQSRENLVCRLLLEKKKTTKTLKL